MLKIREFWRPLGMPINRRIEKLWFFVSFLLIPSFSYSQENTYEVVDSGTSQDITVYTKAMDVANFDRFRYRDARRMLIFTEGVRIELLSVEEVLSNGWEVKHPGTTKPTSTKNYNEPFFRVSKTGHIISVHPLIGK